MSFAIRQFAVQPHLFFHLIQGYAFSMRTQLGQATLSLVRNLRSSQSPPARATSKTRRIFSSRDVLSPAPRQVLLDRLHLQRICGPLVRSYLDSP